MHRCLLHVQELTTSHGCKKESGSVGSMLGWPHHLLGWWHETSQRTDSSSLNPPGRITFLLFFICSVRTDSVILTAVRMDLSHHDRGRPGEVRT